MGKIGQGILGGLSGKVGNVIGGSWKGIDYIRIKPTSVANPRTEGQVNQRNKFSATIEFLQPNKEFINVGYKSFAIKKSAFNAAMSEVINNAITGIAPDFSVNYADALLSKGSLTGALNPSFDLSTPGEVTFSWDNNTSGKNAKATDKAMLLVYNPSKKESTYILEGAERAIGVDSITIPNIFAGDTVELFMAFISQDGKTVSNSSYIGSGTAA
jgi:hypothetical protein